MRWPMLQRLLGWAPSRHEIAGWRWMRPLAPILEDDRVWHLNRRTVARGVALGMFFGICVPFGQSLVAALFALPLRANLAIAALCTFITNPFTTPLVYLGAYETGSWLLHDHSAEFRLPQGDSLIAWLTDAWAWASGAALPVVVGLLVLAVTTAALSFLAIEIGWRAWVGSRWRARRRLRAAAL